MKQERIGSGPIRIGTQIQFEKDVYSLCFTSAYRTEYVYHSQKTNGEGDEQKRQQEELLKKENKEAIENELEEFNLTRQLYNDSILSETLCCFVFQITLCLTLLFTNLLPESNETPTRAVAFTRVMAGMVMQVKMTKELKQGLDKMKFANNHSWKFKRPGFAFIAGLCQASIIMFVTLLNYYTIIDANTVKDVVMNFLALAVITEMDDFFYQIHDADEIGVKMVENQGGLYNHLYTIETTTSQDAEMNEED